MEHNGGWVGVYQLVNSCRKRKKDYEKERRGDKIRKESENRQ